MHFLSSTVSNTRFFTNQQMGSTSYCCGFLKLFSNSIAAFQKDGLPVIFYLCIVIWPVKSIQ